MPFCRETPLGYIVPVNQRHVGLTKFVAFSQMLAVLWVLAAGRPARGDEPAPAGQGGVDLAADARLLTRLAACTGEVPLPESWPVSVMSSHCHSLQALIDKYRTRWIERTRSHLAKIVPATLPKRVVYPFGGGDLFTALHAFPNAEEYTTISLERAGDIRNLASLGRKQIATSLASTREHLRCLFAVSHSKTTNLRAGSHAALTGEITFALVALSLFEYEPISVRYFRLDPQGNIVYLDANDPGDKDSGRSPFANVEISFRAQNDPNAPVRVYRHFAANLHNDHFAANHPLALHLASKGPVTALIKAASYLLWFDSFSHIRSYLLDHAEWMLSDSTGVQPSLARAAGFEQETWGLFHGPFLAQYSHVKDEFLALWEASPKRMLPFYFGYPDIDGHGHMMVTRRVGTSVSTGTSEPATDQVSGGAHWRLLTPKGPVHVWQPRGYDAATAGTVLYVHGYYTNVDGAWVQHALAEQFAASKVNAIFIVPEAPGGGSEEVPWPVLSDLLAEVERQLPGLRAQAPIVATGHSGAWRTLGLWTEEKARERQVDNFILLDGLYGMEDKFQGWLARYTKPDEPRMTLVTQDTAKRVEPFLAPITTARRRAELPETYRDLSPVERNAQVLEITSELEHMEIMTSGKVLPVILHRSALRTLKAPSRFTKATKNKEQEQ
jgi:hypothetical protein